jgi:1,4-dihydroxy-2-naphthoyl-CoA synthase
MFSTRFISRGIIPSSSRFFSASTGYKHILTEVHGKVGLIRLNRPKALNALCNELIDEVLAAGQAFDKNSAIGAIVITGKSKDDTPCIFLNPNNRF